MARFAVYAAPDVGGYLLDVQTDLLENLTTRVVIPLLPIEVAPPRVPRLNPILDIEGAPHSLVTEYIAAVPCTSLSAVVADVSDQSDRITAAVDFLMQGF